MAEIEIRRCNPLYGYRWIAEGVKLFAAQPWPWLALVGITLLLLLVLVMLPLLGIAAAYMLFPGIAAGFLLAAHDALAGRTIGFPHLTAGFKAAAKPLVTVGSLAFLIFFVAILGVMFLWYDDFTRLLQLMQSQASDKAALEYASAHLSRPSFVMLGVMFALVAATWFAPGLILFRNLPPGQAMRVSIRACLMNFAPFLVFGLLFFLMDLAISFVLRLLLGLFLRLGGSAWAEGAALPLTFPILCGFMAILFIAAYVSFQDIFQNKSHA